MRRSRVRKVEHNGSVRYLPEVRTRFLFWMGLTWRGFFTYGTPMECQTEEEAWDYIDDWFREREKPKVTILTNRSPHGEPLPESEDL